MDEYLPLGMIEVPSEPSSDRFLKLDKVGR